MRDVTEVDAYLNLYDPLGNLIASDADDGGLAEIKDLRLEDTGQYILETFDWNHDDTGDYGLSIQKLNAPEYAEFLPCQFKFPPITWALHVRLRYIPLLVLKVIYSTLRCED